MLTLLVGLVLVRVFVTGELRRTARSGAPLDDQLARVRATGSIPASLGMVIGLICAGEVLLEAPFLRDVWGLAGALAAFLFRLAATAVWLDAVVVHLDRVRGVTTPYGPAMARGLRQVVVALLPRYAAAGVVIQLVNQGRLTGVQLMVLYVAFVLVLVVLAPLLHRLGTSTREPTPGEGALLGRLSASYGLHLERVGVEKDGVNARVAGAGPGARIFVGDRVLAGPEDELAAVLAHEVAHRDQHHIAWRTGITVVSAIAMVLVAALLPAAADRGGNTFVVVLVLAFLLPVVRHLFLGAVRVHQEHAADEWAAGRVGAEALAGFLARHDDGIALGGRGALRYHLRTGHPTLAERLHALGVTPAAAR